MDQHRLGRAIQRGEDLLHFLVLQLARGRQWKIEMFHAIHRRGADFLRIPLLAHGGATQIHHGLDSVFLNGLRQRLPAHLAAAIKNSRRNHVKIVVRDEIEHENHQRENRRQRKQQQRPPQRFQPPVGRCDGSLMRVRRIWPRAVASTQQIKGTFYSTEYLSIPWLSPQKYQQILRLLSPEMTSSP